MDGYVWNMQNTDTNYGIFHPVSLQTVLECTLTAYILIMQQIL